MEKESHSQIISIKPHKPLKATLGLGFKKRTPLGELECFWSNIYNCICIQVIYTYDMIPSFDLWKYHYGNTVL